VDRHNFNRACIRILRAVALAASVPAAIATYVSMLRMLAMPPGQFTETRGNIAAVTGLVTGVAWLLFVTKGLLGPRRKLPESVAPWGGWRPLHWNVFCLAPVVWLTSWMVAWSVLPYPTRPPDAVDNSTCFIMAGVAVMYWLLLTHFIPDAAALVLKLRRSRETQPGFER
jgi:hypothetical protein